MQTAHQALMKELHELFPGVQLFSIMGAGGDYNFAYPQTTLTPKQIDQLKTMGLRVSQVSINQAVDSEPTHLHIWISKIQSWD